MEKYYVMWISNGALQVDKITEFTDIHSATAKFASVWSMLEAESTVITGEVVVLDKHFEVVEGCHRTITHEA